MKNNEKPLNSFMFADKMNLSIYKVTDKVNVFWYLFCMGLKQKHFRGDICGDKSK